MREKEARTGGNRDEGNGKDELPMVREGLVAASMMCVTSMAALLLPYYATCSTSAPYEHFRLVQKRSRLD